jgi:hypothetical protein
MSEFTENSANPRSPGDFRGRYCVLEYRPEAWETPTNSSAPVFMLVLESGKSLNFFLSPKWRNFVQAEDLEYVELFIEDVQQRAPGLPKQLFDQLSSLSLGPLVTREAGSNFSEQPAFQELHSRLEPI